MDGESEEEDRVPCQDGESIEELHPPRSRHPSHLGPQCHPASNEIKE